MPITAFVMFEVPAEARDAFVENWEAATPVVASADGFIGGTFYEAPADDAAFRFVNVATWESAEAMARGRDLAVRTEEAAGDHRQQRLQDLGVRIRTVVTHVHMAYGPTDAV